MKTKLTYLGGLIIALFIAGCSYEPTVHDINKTDAVAIVCESHGKVKQFTTFYDVISVVCNDGTAAQVYNSTPVSELSYIAR